MGGVDEKLRLPWRLLACLCERCRCSSLPFSRLVDPLLIMQQFQHKHRLAPSLASSTARSTCATVLRALTRPRAPFMTSLNLHFNATQKKKKKPDQSTKLEYIRVRPPLSRVVAVQPGSNRKWPRRAGGQTERRLNEPPLLLIRLQKHAGGG